MQPWLCVSNHPPPSSHSSLIKKLTLNFYPLFSSVRQVEDGAVLGNLFSRLSHPSQIAPLLYAYETLRLPRTAKVQASSRLNQYIFHLEDGPEQVKRDQEMRQAMHGEEGVNNPNQWADKRKTVELMGYDADKAVDEWWAERGEKEIGKLADVGAEATRRMWAQQAEARL